MNKWKTLKNHKIIKKVISETCGFASLDKIQIVEMESQFVTHWMT